MRKSLRISWRTATAAAPTWLLAFLCSQEIRNQFLSLTHRFDSPAEELEPVHRRQLNHIKCETILQRSLFACRCKQLLISFASCNLTAASGCSSNSLAMRNKWPASTLPPPHCQPALYPSSPH